MKLAAASPRNGLEWRMRSAAASFVNDKIRLITVLILVPMVASFFGEWHWMLELTSHFQAHYLAGLALCLIGFVCSRDWRWSAVVLLAMVWPAILVVPWFIEGRRTASPGGEPLRLMLINVHTRNTQSQRVIELAKAENVHFAVLQEIDERWVKDLQPIRDFLPEEKVIPREDNFGIGIYSRIPVGEVREIASGPFEVPSITAEVRLSRARIFVMATHPVPPASSVGADARNAHLLEIAETAARAKQPVIVVGDLNVTMWSPAYRNFERASGLRNTRKGNGILPTWPAQLSPLGIPLDHCLVSENVHVAGVRRGQRIGSDHLPLILDLLIPSPE